MDSQRVRFRDDGGQKCGDLGDGLLGSKVRNHVERDLAVGGCADVEVAVYALVCVGWEKLHVGLDDLPEVLALHVASRGAREISITRVEGELRDCDWEIRVGLCGDGDDDSKGT